MIYTFFVEEIVRKAKLLKPILRTVRALYYPQTVFGNVVMFGNVCATIRTFLLLLKVYGYNTITKHYHTLPFHQNKGEEV